VIWSLPPSGRQKSFESSFPDIKGVMVLVVSGRYVDLARAVRRIKNISPGAEERMTRGMVELLGCVEVASVVQRHFSEEYGNSRKESNCKTSNYARNV
jgi:hypothetical protein